MASPPTTPTRTHIEDVALAVSRQAARDGLDFLTALHTLLTDIAPDTDTRRPEEPPSNQETTTQTTLTAGAWGQPDSTPSLEAEFQHYIQPAPDFPGVGHPTIPMAALPTTLTGRVALVGCGEQKRPGTHHARDLYTSTYFAKKREFAEHLCDTWTICSAKYGLLNPYRRIPSYDVTDSDIHATTWLEHIETQLSTHLKTDRVNELWVLLGTRYLSLEPESGGPSFRDRIEALPCDVYFPFDETAGIGYQMGWINTCLEQNTVALPSELK